MKHSRQITHLSKWEARKEAPLKTPKRLLATPAYVDPAPTILESMLIIKQKAEAAAGKKAVENAKVAAEEDKQWSKGSKSGAKK